MAIVLTIVQKNLVNWVVNQPGNNIILGPAGIYVKTCVIQLQIVGFRLVIMMSPIL